MMTSEMSDRIDRAAQKCAWYITGGLTVQQIAAAYARIIREELQNTPERQKGTA